MTACNTRWNGRFFTPLPVGRIRHRLVRIGALLGPTARGLPRRLARQRPASERMIHGLDDVHAACAHYVDTFPTTNSSRRRPPSRPTLIIGWSATTRWQAAIRRREHAGPTERDIYCLLHQRSVSDAPWKIAPTGSSSSSASAPSRCLTRRPAASTSAPSANWRR